MVHVKDQSIRHPEHSKPKYDNEEKDVEYLSPEHYPPEKRTRINTETSR